MDIFCLLMTNKKCLFIAASCEDTVALQQQQCRQSRPKMGFQSAHEVLLMWSKAVQMCCGNEESEKVHRELFLAMIHQEERAKFQCLE